MDPERKLALFELLVEMGFKLVATGGTQRYFEDKGVPHVKKDGAKGLIYIDKFDPSKVTMGSAPAKKAKAAKPVEPEDDEEEDLEDEEEPTTGSIEDEDTDEEDEEDFDDED